MKKILVIEDEPELLRNLATIFQMEGFTVEQADNGASGVHLARTRHPDLILCDITMADMDGYSVLRALREDTHLSAIPFLFLTARAERTDFRTGMELGADDFITKPVSIAQLLAVVNAHLSQKDTPMQPRNFAFDFSQADSATALPVSR